MSQRNHDGFSGDMTPDDRLDLWHRAEDLHDACAVNGRLDAAEFWRALAGQQAAALLADQSPAAKAAIADAVACGGCGIRRGLEHAAEEHAHRLLDPARLGSIAARGAAFVAGLKPDSPLPGPGEREAWARAFRDLGTEAARLTDRAPRRPHRADPGRE